MNKIKSFWVSFSAGIASFVALFAACPGAACFGCGAACYIPILSALGLSSAGFMTPEYFSYFQPLFIAISAVLFTIAYYSLYKKGKKEIVCESESIHDCRLKKPEKKNTFIKVFFWLSVIVCIGIFAYPIFNKSSGVKIPLNKSHNTTVHSGYGFFDTDCLYWDEESQSLMCKKRVQAISSNVYKLHEYAVKNNITTLFTTCCSARMPRKNEMDSIGIAYIPLDLSDSSWKNGVNKKQSFYIAKMAYGNPKMNYDKEASDMFKFNKNLPVLLDSLKIENWIVFGDAFELCVNYAVNGMLSRGYHVTVIEDMVSPKHGGNKATMQQALDELRGKGVQVKKLKDILK